MGLQRGREEDGEALEGVNTEGAGVLSGLEGGPGSAVHDHDRIHGGVGELAESGGHGVDGRVVVDYRNADGGRGGDRRSGGDSADDGRGGEVHEFVRDFVHDVAEEGFAAEAFGLVGEADPLLDHARNEGHDAENEGFLVGSVAAFGVDRGRGRGSLEVDLEVPLHEDLADPGGDAFTLPGGADRVLDEGRDGHGAGAVLGDESAALAEVLVTGADGLAERVDVLLAVADFFGCHFSFLAFFFDDFGSQAGFDFVELRPALRFGRLTGGKFCVDRAYFFLKRSQVCPVGVDLDGNQCPALDKFGRALVFEFHVRPHKVFLFLRGVPRAPAPLFFRAPRPLHSPVQPEHSPAPRCQPVSREYSSFCMPAR